MKRRNTPAVRDPTPEYGPCMRALPVRWQRAVEALFVTDGDRTKALEICGYKSDNRESLRAQASRIFKDNRVRAAIKEECIKEIDISEPESIAMTRKIMRDIEVNAAVRLKAASMIWDHANPVMTKHQITVEHHMTDDERDIRHWHALKKLGAPSEAFLARFGPNGLARVEAMVAAEQSKQHDIDGNTIEAEYEEIQPAPANAAIEQRPEFDEDLL